MFLVDYLFTHPVGTAPKVSLLDNMFVVARKNAVSRLLNPSVHESIGKKDNQNYVIFRLKSERGLCHQKQMRSEN